MADQEHLDRLKQGVLVWNIWRAEHPTISPDLSKANLFRANLSGVNLRGADLRGANFTEADLRNATLRGAYLGGASLGGANLSQADLVLADLSDADLSLVHYRTPSSVSTSPFDDFEELDVSIIRETILIDSILSKADLTNANLSGANFTRANLSEADLRGANLSNANLSEANLSHALISQTIFMDIDLRTTLGLDTVRHSGPSLISTSTLERSEGYIPEAFLRGAGLSDTFITYARSLTQKAIEYYTCFISYSSKDIGFAERLYADLQQKGIRCWFAPEDMKTGDKIRDRIDQSIRLYDKLLLVLSQCSIASSWVEFEVEAALAKETVSNRLVLFPIRLDDAINTCQISWATHLHHTRHITDFTEWKQHDAYQQKLTQLIRDLQASTSSKPQS